jgi:hypothetical protein
MEGKDNETSYVQVRLSPLLNARIRRLAREEGSPVSSIVRRAA